MVMDRGRMGGPNFRFFEDVIDKWPLTKFFLTIKHGFVFRFSFSLLSLFLLVIFNVLHVKQKR